MTLLLLSLSSCASGPPVSEVGHKNFKSSMNAHVGSSIDQGANNAAAFTRRSSLIDIVHLPNGIDEYRFKYYLGTCYYFFEVDPKTHIIMGYRFEGSEKDCILVP